MTKEVFLVKFVAIVAVACLYVNLASKLREPHITFFAGVVACIAMLCALIKLVAAYKVEEEEENEDE